MAFLWQVPPANAQIIRMVLGLLSDTIFFQLLYINELAAYSSRLATKKIEWVLIKKQRKSGSIKSCAHQNIGNKKHSCGRHHCEQREALWIVGECCCLSGKDPWWHWAAAKRRAIGLRNSRGHSSPGQHYRRDHHRWSAEFNFHAVLYRKVSQEPSL